jgi:hypothetical protein
MLNVKVEECVNVKFLTKLGKSTTETYNLLMEVYGDECLSGTQVFEWFKRFNRLVPYAVHITPAVSVTCRRSTYIARGLQR